MTSIQQLCWVSIQADFPIHSLTHTFRKTYRGLLRSLWGFHPHPADPHCCQQLRSVLQEQALAERGGSEEEGDYSADCERSQIRQTQELLLVITVQQPLSIWNPVQS